MTALLVGVLTASFLGSLHCVAMCGPLVGLYSAGCTGGGCAKPKPGWRAHAAYQSGRLLTLLLLGLLLGALGTGLNLASEGLGLQRGVAVVTGVVMVLLGLLTTVAPGRTGLRLPAWAMRAAGAVLARLEAQSPARRALAIGVVTPLLPCGWLYLFFLAAAGSGDPLGGAAVLAAFWAGNAPVLVGLGVSLQAGLRRALRGRTKRIGGVALALVGVLLLVTRPRLPAPTVTASPALTTPRVPTVEDQSSLPCCDAEN